MKRFLRKGKATHRTITFYARHNSPP
jgi:hypothetical protein